MRSSMQLRQDIFSFSSTPPQNKQSVCFLEHSLHKMYMSDHFVTLDLMRNRPLFQNSI